MHITRCTYNVRKSPDRSSDKGGEGYKRGEHSPTARGRRHDTAPGEHYFAHADADHDRLPGSQHRREHAYFTTGKEMNHLRSSSREEVSDAGVGASRTQRTDAIRAMTVRIKRYSEAMWGGTQADNSRVEGLLEEAYRVHDVPLNEEAATRWGKENFPGGIPQSAVDECEAELERKG